MSRYSIIPSQHARGYQIKVAGDDGARQTMLGFSTETEAREWIAADQRRAGLQQPISIHDTAD